jgi:hypothetical protein
MKKRREDKEQKDREMIFFLQVVYKKISSVEHFSLVPI